MSFTFILSCVYTIALAALIVAGLVWLFPPKPPAASPRMLIDWLRQPRPRLPPRSNVVPSGLYPPGGPIPGLAFSAGEKKAESRSIKAGRNETMLTNVSSAIMTVIKFTAAA